MDHRKLEDLYPLSPMQQGMLFQTLQWPGSGVCFEQDVYTIRGDVDGREFSRAWELIIDRHAVLRTTYIWEGLDKPHQVVHHQGVLDLKTDDWRGLYAEQQRRRLEEYLAAERQRSFDPSTQPLMRLGLFRVGDNEHQLVWHYHHAVLDGWSVPLVIKDVLTAYESIRSNLVVDLPERRPYRDFIEWLLEQDIAAAETYWRRLLEASQKSRRWLQSGIAPHDILAADQTFQNASHTLACSLTNLLQTFSRRHQVTISTLIQGAWALLLSRYAGTDDVVFGCSISGRPPELVGVEGMIGLFINTLPLRVKTSGGAPALQWLKSIQEQVVQALDYGFTPLMQVQKWSQISPGQSLFESIVVVENYPTFTDASNGQSLTIAHQAWAKHSETGYPLTLVAHLGDQLRLEIKFDHRLFDSLTVLRMLGHLETLLEGLSLRPKEDVISLPLFSERERNELIHVFSAQMVTATESVLPHDGSATLHGLFEAQAASQPEATAITCDGQSLTYAELNERANRVAQHLSRYGVLPDTLVRTLRGSV